MYKIGAIKDPMLIEKAHDAAADCLCSYCFERIAEADDFLRCRDCQSHVHVKCLRHASTPGDLLGDVFFDFTCANCMQTQLNGSMASSVGGAREKFVRQRMPWLLVITLALFNLSIKSKGLSHHGFFHWRSHIISFIDKNWDYLFEPSTRRRKNWIGSITGALSHNCPEFFVSGHDKVNEAGWWKLAYANQTPRYVYAKYELQCQKRIELRNVKRLMQEGKNDPPAPIIDLPQREAKRRRRSDSQVELDSKKPTIDSCSRTLPYMGRKSKVGKQLNIVVDDDVGKSQQQIQPPSSIQSSLMDFLAKNLDSDDLTLFNTLPTMAAEPLKSSGGRSDFQHTLIEDEAYGANNLFDIMPDFNSAGPSSSAVYDHGGYDKLMSYDDANMKGGPKIQHMKQQLQLESGANVKEQGQAAGLLHNSMSTSFKHSNDTNAKNEIHNYEPAEGEDDEDAYKPRIIQVTNFQELEADETELHATTDSGVVDSMSHIKEEIESDTEDWEKSPGASSQQCNGSAQKEETRTYEVEADALNRDDNCDALEPGKASLFAKRTSRNWPWLMKHKRASADEDGVTTGEVSSDSGACSSRDGRLVMMSEYEEIQLLQKLSQIIGFDAAQKKNIDSVASSSSVHIPSYIRRLYRHMCVRAWKREHGRPLFNLDKQLLPQCYNQLAQQEDKKIIDRYQMIAVTSQDAQRSFYARIAGCCQHELFESPYSQRILHPFIYRSKECFPPWLKLMCEIKYASTGIIPQRATVDYCYVRPNHIAAVNALLQSAFWPGIDMSECLSYPDFSVVAMYRRLVIGCGFLVPDVGFNEAYISFMAVRPGWQRSGIATFMLYHLLQTCMNKDITLHVSASNPAIMLYQKFGFKIEEVILNFYDKYLPIDSKHSRNAFFLRLMH